MPPRSSQRDSPESWDLLVGRAPQVLCPPTRWVFEPVVIDGVKSGPL